MRPHNASRKHQLRSSTARLVRLATVTCLALAVAGSAVVWAHPVRVVTTGHRCIHDQIQQRVLQSVTQQHGNLGALSAVGLPSVAAAPDLDSVSGTVDFALPYTTGPDVTRSKDWGELRITVSTDNFTDTERYCTQDGQSINDKNGDVKCSEDDILTEEKRDILINSILPEAVRLHTDRLKVRQVQSNWTVAVGNGKICGVFNAPQTHLTNGVNNTDFLLYVVSLTTDRGAVSWGATCQVFPDGQPAVGVINVPAAQIVSRYDQRVIRTVAHQIAHALGFSEDFFQKAGITKFVEDIRSKPDNFTVINGSTTVEKARTHYNCSTLEYVEMNNRPNVDWENSHLSMRNAKDELMAPEVGAGYYTALTMAIFEDTRFYKADFSKAEVMTWGRNASCAFLNDKCMENNITQWPQMFCNDTNEKYRCTSSRLHVGGCDVVTYPKSLDSHWRYFTNDRLGGSTAFLDICPVVVPSDEGACNQNTTTAPWYVRSFNVFSEAARCIDGSFTPKGLARWRRLYNGMCANIRCDMATQTYGIQVKWGSGYFNCTPGQNISLDTISNGFEDGGYITCPPYAEVCQGNVKAVVDFKAALEKNRGTSSSSAQDNAPADSMTSSAQDNAPADSMTSSAQDNAPADSMTSSAQDNALADSMTSSQQDSALVDSMPSSQQDSALADSMPSSQQDNALADSMTSSGKDSAPADSMTSSGKDSALADSMTSSGKASALADSMPSSGKDSALAESMPNNAQGNAPADSMPSSGRGHTPTDSIPNSGRGHIPTDSMLSSGRGHTPTDSMPSSGSGAGKPNATSSNGKGDRLYPRGNGAAGLRSTWSLVSAGVALLVVTLTVGLSA